ncbi:hypothetical protein BV508_28290, partial [Mycobacterium intermedium]
GLYPGNKVQLLGIEVGGVTAVTNKPDFVQVDFTVPKDLDLPAARAARVTCATVRASRAGAARTAPTAEPAVTSIAEEQPPGAAGPTGAAAPAVLSWPAGRAGG